ncbi:MAG TPA: LCP family protein [Ardenticatenaceae bacterium]|nr:LCP family protein [Ardenticatenaceae bacterium]
MRLDHLRRARVPLPWFDVFMSGLLTVFLVGGLVSSFLVYRSVRNFVARSQLVNLPSLSSQPPAVPTAPQEQPQEQPVVEPETGQPVVEPTQQHSQEPSKNILPPPAEKTPVPEDLPELSTAMNILLLGIDKRETEDGPFRTDTMIVVRADPVNKGAALLSIPRDLWVQLPDYGYGRRWDRINTAHVWGEVYEYPGGGPALAKRTIELNFGISIDRYVVVDFDAFENFVDLIGGIEIDVPAELTDYQYPTEDYGYMTVHFDAGQQHMNGQQALIYARTRHADSDFHRAGRQQQVMLAVREKVLSRNIIPSLTPANIVRIAREFEDSVITDLTIDEMFTLARTVDQIPDGGIRQLVIDSELVYDGYDYTLVGRWDEIQAAVADLFDTSTKFTARATPTPAADLNSDDEGTDVVADAPRIEVRNGTALANLEELGAVYLQRQGHPVTGIGPAERDDYEYTTLVVYSEESDAVVESLSSILSITPDHVRLDPDGREDVDIMVILGADAEYLLSSS